jgi:RNA polymerase sigma-70 factor (ECF subfamily)
MDEGGLVAQAQHGDRDAFRRLVEIYAPVVGRTTRALLADRGEAEDAEQEAWVDVWRGLPRFEVGRPFRPWLLAVVSNRCHMKARRRTLTTVPYDSESVEHAPVEDEGPGAEIDGELHEALARLDEDQRRVLALRYYADLQLDEIAEVLGVPLGTVKSRLHRGLGTLRGLLSAHSEAKALSESKE